ncbi:hypothetical protein CK203_005183 [Vitis vinifera]|uniref:Uncharacterized protein n=1 Tax=Vitis vinifera TaxID=29760 RepID=A0A438FZ61_VITVI|nr:hypothetical protein CK203_049609 [Vitis vinifera]RVX19619.1 hypothetical protein CK203_005183 [Vitis vinifera]
MEKTQILARVWCRDAPLKDFFPSLFSFAANKEAWVVNAQEVARGRLQVFRKCTKDKDDLIWKASKSEKFLEAAWEKDPDLRLA